ncbi:2-amino-3-carboxymuconate-6-semialdehyde decarboxylase-like protein [Neoconidiobolus thromboides FSU 785]|nr:2-amino-3-carboxymuconate-6-semialdehyde decarboxylase-like protein [Neoconidiobolus thromboides FSU 785]
MSTTNSNKFLKIDIHTHILPKQLPDLSRKYGYGSWVSLDHFEPGKANMMKDGKNFRTIECNCWSSSQRIKECNDTGVDVQVISTVPVMFNYWAKPQHTLDLAKYLNDHVAQTVAEDPSRFIGLGTLPMQAPDLAIQEMKRCVNELGLPGVQIGSHINEWNLDAPELDLFFKAAEELGCVIFVHPWDMETKGRMEKYWFPWLIGMPCETTIAVCSLIFGGVFDRYPKLKVCFAHGGGSFLATLGRIDHGFNVRPDLCATHIKKPPSSYLKQIFVDSLVHDLDALKFMVGKVGVDNILLGSDYPFPLGEHHPGKLIEDASEFSDEDKEKMLSGNALKLFNLKPENYLRN